MAVSKHNHTHVTSRDPQKAVEFYTKVLGASLVFERESGSGIITEVQLGGIPIRITGANTIDKSKADVFGLHHLGMEVDNMDEFAAKMKASSVEFVVEPSAMPNGDKVAFIKGPDEVLFEIVEFKK